MTRTFPAALALVLTLALPALAQDPGKTVLEACGKCHSVKKVCAALGGKDKAAWLATVERMASKGAQVAQDQRPALAEWLAAQSAGAKPVCE
ncbi:hypothetical protein NNJEOMEG_01012 [Fundidesulfovibrio magnetotacticus]|uniref:Cytochrome c domain-containing protein n=1 Tax=Fundidesulfovibrio magnetotacticus TaxID=2730080 RepID=A0A6V8LRK0_9BACT|nr:hypothetical protein [Fundidesulfovibrio magnetotacticus]GFK93181.1 hypothetical protein NNJEOMEG_01012 [Fundidesulfovibrio magnetotacticus]